MGQVQALLTRIAHQGEHSQPRSPVVRKNEVLHKQRHRVIEDDSDSTDSDGAFVRFRIPRSRERDLKEMQRHPTLVDKSDPIMWLIRYKQFGKIRFDNANTYRSCLGYIWNDDNSEEKNAWWD